MNVDETFQELKFWLGYAEYVCKNSDDNYIVKDTLEFTTVESFAEFIEKHIKSRRTLYVMAHNIQHDLLTMKLLDTLLSRGFELYGGYVEGTTFILRVRNKKGRIVFLDTYNFFHTSVEHLGQMLGIEKVHLNLECDDAELWMGRCKKDVLIIREAFIRFISFLKQHDYGSLALSIAGQSFKTFRHRFLNVKIHIHNNEEANELERKAYGGGMVRCFKVGKFSDGPYYKLDVNSEYPYVMSCEFFPVQLVRVWNGCSLESLKELLNMGCIIADVIIDPIISFFRRRVPGKVIYPLYRFRTVMTTPEIEFALELGCELEVKKIALYRKSKPFKDFMLELYEMRQKYKREGNDVYATMMKYLMNSLSGKWGARAISLKVLDELRGLNVKVDEWVDPETHVHYKVYWIKDTPFIFHCQGESFNSFPAISAHITGYGRVYLSKLIMEAGLRNVFYCDTDSVIVDQKGFDNLKHLIGENLGQLKLEGVAQEVTILSRKDYVFDDDIVLKGIPITCRVVNERGEVVKEEWTQFKGYYGKTVNRRYGITRRVVTLKREVYDGIVMDDGTVFPYIKPPPFDPDPMTLF